ncbi:hypothetical protein [Tenacibaculum finnmarkense]|uniref:hypothetical protein n=1 Tax=Tenacibaculum finnmarkense TaxID=2781243 RepID=UPI00187B3FBC|nr:hypothetical protein [Tenacibaculum finnmarkense]MBE7693694.1 hypothetical protein [Tenacibaculum finnmarkense genomovar finnmarkense]MCD8448045.1 hypothetical protein [Tenacibaculum finnmarkense genomovar finnmarkense]WCC46290.1 hypothetical protein PJH08_07755 [Tenacibaculum finnmarkense]
MNINSLNDYIEQFEIEIIDSGFKRDIKDYITSFGQIQNNIIALRDIANKVHIKLDWIYKTDLADNLEKLLAEKVNSFTKTNYSENFENLINDTEIPQAKFYQKLNQLLTQLHNEINLNKVEIDKIKKFIEPYLETQEETLTSEEKAITSIIFKDHKTITDLKEFTKNLQNWNKILPVYHQVLSSSSPEDIEIITIQNGSIDLLVNLDIDLAINLTEVFEYGYKSFLAFLSYKKMAKPIIDGYLGNKKLISGEKVREKELINNIGEAVKQIILEQHNKAIEEDKKIEKNSTKMIEQVTKLVTSHILKGNEFKILAIPEIIENEEDENETHPNEKLRNISMQVKKAVKSLPQNEMKKLLEQYKEPNQESEK